MHLDHLSTGYLACVCRIGKSINMFVLSDVYPLLLIEYIIHVWLCTAHKHLTRAPTFAHTAAAAAAI